MGQIKTWMLAVAATISLSAAVYSYDKSEAIVSKSCACSTNTVQMNYNLNEQCNLEAHTSWFAWLTGGSSSAQFHYLDLLELLIGSEDSELDSDNFTSRF